MVDQFEGAPAGSEDRSLDMDAITAHLDRGWDLLRRGDGMGARLSAQHILDLDDESPEGHTLLGAIVAAEGDAEQAMELFAKALEADPDYLDAMLYAAEIAIHPLRDFDAALQFCEEAEHLVAGSDEAVDVFLLRAEACLAAGQDKEAQRALERLPAGPYRDSSYELRVGRICIDLGQHEQAVALLERAAAEEKTPGEAHYFLGVALEMAGRVREGLEKLVAVREADLGAPDPEWALDEDQFAEVVEEVVRQLQGPVGADVQAAPLHVLEIPSLELVVEGFDPRAPIYLAGASPKMEVGAGKGGRSGASRKPHLSEPTGLALAAVVVYKRNVERYADSSELIVEELRAALVQELAHFYGLEERDAERLFTGPGTAH